MKRKIVSGNYFNSFSTNGITVGSDFKITEPSGENYFYRYRVTGSEEITILDSTDIVFESSTEWEDLPLSIREKHFSIIFPDYKMICFAKENLLKFIVELGEFQSVKRLRSSLNANSDKYFVYLFDEKKRVTITVTANSFSYIIEDNEVITSNRKDFGKRIRRLCNKVDIPWDIGCLVGHIESDETALEILNKIKSSRGRISEKYRSDLLCGSIKRMRICFMNILGIDSWKLLNIQSRKKLVILASYITGITN